MNYLDLALEIATSSHHLKIGKDLEPYINYPIFASTLVSSETKKIVALLHDVVEYTEITLEYLKSQGFSDEINYLNFIKNIDIK